MVNLEGPLLLASNHPNSFLDAAIMAEIFRHPIYSLTRGDVFKKPFYAKLLTALNMLPVYRTSEGVENLNENYQTFNACKKIFAKNGIVLIFSEGKCINEWHLRPLRKGTARLAFSSWEENIPLRVLPVGINYSSFRRFSKNMFINFGEMISKDDFNQAEGDGKKHQAFNQKLQEQLEKAVLEIEKNDQKKQKQLLEIRPSTFSKIILAIPGLLGFLIHAPIYLPLKSFTVRKTRNNDHHDSILVALLLFFYPLYILFITALGIFLTGNWYFLLLFLLLPLTAWAYLQLKPQIDKEITSSSS